MHAGATAILALALALAASPSAQAKAESEARPGRVEHSPPGPAAPAGSADDARRAGEGNQILHPSPSRLQPAAGSTAAPSPPAGADRPDVALAVASSNAVSGPPDVATSRAAVPDPYATAVSDLLDIPRSRESIERALDIAETLRRIYGIDSGDRFADRAAAARRARREIIDAVRPAPAELEAAAEALGLSLDPALCANWCGNARRLALAELQKKALEQFIERAASAVCGEPISPAAAEPRPPAARRLRQTVERPQGG